MAIVLSMAGLLSGAVAVDGSRVTFTSTDTRATEMYVNIMAEGSGEAFLTLPLGREGKVVWSAALTLPGGSYAYTLSASYDGGMSHVTGYDRENSGTSGDKVSRFSVLSDTRDF